MCRINAQQAHSKVVSSIRDMNSDNFFLVKQKTSAKQRAWIMWSHFLCWSVGVRDSVGILVVMVAKRKCLGKKMDIDADFLNSPRLFCSTLEI